MSERENGQDAGMRNVGRFFLALIPWALGLGATVWFGVWMGLRTYNREVAQEKRAAAYVGATERPKEKIAVEMVPRGCVRVTRADVDGDVLLVYAQNRCGSVVWRTAWQWQIVSPNNTVLKQGYENYRCGMPSEPGDSAECRIELPMDDRTLKVRVWVDDYHR